MRTSLPAGRIALVVTLSVGCDAVFGIEPRRDAGPSHDGASCPGTLVTATIDSHRIVSAPGQFEAFVADPIAPAQQQHQVVLEDGQVVPTELDPTGTTLRFCLPAGAGRYRLRSRLGDGDPPRDVISRAAALRLGRIAHGRADAALAAEQRTLRVQVPTSAASNETVIIRTTGVAAVYVHPTPVSGAFDAQIWGELRHLDDQARLLDGSRGDQLIFLTYRDNGGPQPNRTLARFGRTSQVDLVNHSNETVILNLADAENPSLATVPLDADDLANLRAGLPDDGALASDVIAVRGFVRPDRVLSAEVLLGYRVPAASGADSTMVSYAGPGSLSPELEPRIQATAAFTRRFVLGSRSLVVAQSAEMFLGLQDGPPAPAPVVHARFAATAAVTVDGADASGLDPEVDQDLEVIGFEQPGPDLSLVVLVLEVVSGSLASDLAMRLVHSFVTVEPTSSLQVPAGTLRPGGLYLVMAGARRGLTGPAAGDWSTLTYPFAQTITQGTVFRVP